MSTSTYRLQENEVEIGDCRDLLSCRVTRRQINDSLQLKQGWMNAAPRVEKGQGSMLKNRLEFCRLMSFVLNSVNLLVQSQ